jgi:penicillin-binding protein-related factor A (putative recombinase)
MATIGNRGKWAEARVKAFLKKRESTTFTHHRFPDARAGSMVTAPADFMFMSAGVMTLLEVKEVQHDFRLPHKNFSTDQVARMRAWKAAGARALVLIHHSTSGFWRLLDIDRFVEREGGSWDLSNSQTYSEREALCLL